MLVLLMLDLWFLLSLELFEFILIIDPSFPLCRNERLQQNIYIIMLL